MRRAVKITISLPKELLAAVESCQKERGETRSEIIAYLLDAALHREREKADVERYIRGYLAQPDTEEEVGLSDRLAVEAAARDPWP